MTIKHNYDACILLSLLLNGDIHNIVPFLPIVPYYIFPGTISMVSYIQRMTAVYPVLKTLDTKKFIR